MTDDFIPIPTLEETPKIPEILPVLPLREVVVYPYVIQPLSVSREKSIRAIDAALVENRMILLVSQKQVEIDNPTPSPVEAFPCGSRSISSVRQPIAAIAVAILIAVVVLPTPPFWFAMAIVIIGCFPPSRTQVLTMIPASASVKECST